MRTRAGRSLLGGLLLLSLLPACRSRAHRQPAAIQLPDTPAARQFQAWLGHFNRGDGPAYMAFLEEHYPSRASQLRRNTDPAGSGRPFQFGRRGFREMTGGFDLRKIEESAPARIVGLAQERASDRFARFTAVVDEAAPHRIQAIEFKPAERPPEFSLAMTENALVAALGQKVASEADADRFAGSVLLARNGGTLFSGAYGLADRERKLANTVDTRFRIASMTKMFTAVAILQLVQGGKIDLHQPIARYLPDYPNRWVAERVTVHQLLTHTAGVHDFMGPEYRGSLARLRTLQDYLTQFADRRLDFQPGTRMQYSNYGYVVLGLILERVSGQSYYDHVREHVFSPAGMTATGSQPEDEAVPGRAVSYTTARIVWQPPRIDPDVQVGDDLHPATDSLPYRGTSAGGGYSTVGDLRRFIDALQGHRLLTPQYTELLTAKKVDDPGKRDGYAYGFEVERLNGRPCYGHSGAWDGMNGVLWSCPASGYLIVVLANQDPPAAANIADFIAARLPSR